MENPCPYCNENFPKDFPGLNVRPHVRKVAFKLWLARGRVVRYSQLGDGTLSNGRAYVGIFRAALKDYGLPWVVIIEREVGARLVKIQER